MSFNDSNNPLIDRKFITAAVLIIAFMMGWQWFLSKKYPSVGQADNRVVAKPADPINSANPPAISAAAVADGKKNADLKTTTTIKPEALFSYEDEKVRFTVSSHGLGLKEFVRTDYKDRDGQPIRIGLSPLGNLFEASAGNPAQTIDFDVKELEKGSYEATARTSAGVITRKMRYDSSKQAFENSITVTEATAELTHGLSLLIPDTIRVFPVTFISRFMPSYQHQDFSVEHEGKSDTISVSRSKENVNQDIANVSVVSGGDQYFASAIKDSSDVAPDVHLMVNNNDKVASALLTYKPVQPKGEMTFRQTLYAGPRSVDVLQNIDPAMVSLINFGSILGFITKPLLYLMKWLYALVGNWGFAIILLTLLVRTVVLPFNLLSVRSMKNMQKIQPLMKEVRERYKDDPAAQQRETMALMKEHKANPLGGCLPMLIQIPVFFALYRVISISVELYRAPFAGWIQDLSMHDPFYVLPVLMGLSMFVQSKMTPTAMDPAQAKVMQFLPVIFTVFMVTVPSGLTLYMVVSALFGITQQYFVLKSSKQTAAVVPMRGSK